MRCAANFEHPRVDVSGDDLRLRYGLMHCPGDDAGAGGGLENAGRLEKRGTLGNELRIGLEQQADPCSRRTGRESNA